MEILIAMFDAAFTIGITLLGLVTAYMGYRLIRAIRVYLKFRGTRLVTCPETSQDEVVELAAAAMGIQAILDEPCLEISQCSRWPMREGCGQDCLRQIEARPAELRISSAWRVT